MTKTCPVCLTRLYHRAWACERCGYDFLTGSLPPLADDRPRPPFPFFGTKRKVADDVWRVFGRVSRYVEPFMGSAALILARPRPVHTVANDRNRYLSNFWRAVQFAPEETARWADWPVNEADLLARHRWLESRPFERAIAGTPDPADLLRRLRRLEQRLDADPLWYDPVVAGWWAWGQCCTLRGGWCTNHSPRFAKPAVNTGGLAARRFECVKRMGVNRGQHDLDGHTPAPDAGDRTQHLIRYFHRLQAGMRDVIVACGHWERVVTPAVLGDRPCAVFLDPPYSTGFGCYGRYGDGRVARRVRDWAAEWGRHPRLRIALCGHEGEHALPSGWTCYRWDGGRGFSTVPDAGRRERIWFSPACQTFARLSALVRV